MEGKSVDILPEEFKTERTRNDLVQDRKVELKNTLKSHRYSVQKLSMYGNKKNGTYLVWPPVELISFNIWNTGREETSFKLFSIFGLSFH